MSPLISNLSRNSWAIRARKTWKSWERFVFGGTVSQMYGSINRIETRCYRPELATRLDWVKELYPPVVEDYRCLSQFGPFFTPSKAFDRLTLCQVRDMCVDLRSGLSWVPGGDAIQESVAGGLVRMQIPGFMEHRTLVKTVPGPADGPYLAVDDLGYFHFVAESLPLLITVLNQMPDVGLLISSRVGPYVMGALEILEARLGQTLKVYKHENPLRMPTLLIARKVDQSGFCRKELVCTLRNDLAGPLTPNGPAGESIWVGRRVNEKRSCVDTARVDRLASECGWTVLYLQDLAFQQQIQRLMNAKRLGGTHGAGLVNMVWCQNLQQVTEVHLHGYFNDCYARLAVNCGAAYQPFLPERVGFPGRLSQENLDAIKAMLKLS